MNEYRIIAYYETGDSFKRYDTDTTLTIVWTDLDKAKAALKRIKEHYEWYSDKSSWRPKNIPEPEWHKGEEYEFCLKLELDNGNFVQIVAPWCGYFEKLHSAEILSKADDDMKFEVDRWR